MTIFVRILALVAAFLLQGCAAGNTTAVQPATLRVSGAVQNTLTLDAVALQSLPATTQTISGSGPVGIDLWTVLTQAGIRSNPAVKNDALAMMVVATGADGYQAAFSLAELDPGIGHRAAVIVWGKGNKPSGGDGMFRLMVPGDLKKGRSVFALVKIEVLNLGSR